MILCVISVSRLQDYVLPEKIAISLSENVRFIKIGPTTAVNRLGKEDLGLTLPILCFLAWKECQNVFRENIYIARKNIYFPSWKCKVYKNWSKDSQEKSRRRGLGSAFDVIIPLL